LGFNLILYFLGSSWSIVSVNEMCVQISKYQPLRFGLGLPTPQCYKSKQGLINIRTSENKCFAFCVIAAFLRLRTKNAERPLIYQEFLESNYDRQTKIWRHINFSMLDFIEGVELSEISKFEKLNPRFSVNIYAHDDEDNTIFPNRITLEQKEIHVDLMSLSDVDTGVQHLIYIQDFNLFMKRANCHKR
jgi:hypothetical protein